MVVIRFYRLDQLGHAAVSFGGDNSHIARIFGLRELKI